MNAAADLRSFPVRPVCFGPGGAGAHVAGLGGFRPSGRPLPSVFHCPAWAASCKCPLPRPECPAWVFGSFPIGRRFRLFAETSKEKAVPLPPVRRKRESASSFASVPQIRWTGIPSGTFDPINKNRPTPHRTSGNFRDRSIILTFRDIYARHEK